MQKFADMPFIKKNENKFILLFVEVNKVKRGEKSEHRKQ